MTWPIMVWVPIAQQGPRCAPGFVQFAVVPTCFRRHRSRRTLAAAIRRTAPCDRRRKLSSGLSHFRDLARHAAAASAQQRTNPFLAATPITGNQAIALPGEGRILLHAVGTARWVEHRRHAPVQQVGALPLSHVRHRNLVLRCKRAPVRCALRNRNEQVGHDGLDPVGAKFSLYRWKLTRD